MCTYILFRIINLTKKFWSGLTHFHFFEAFNITINDTNILIS